MLNPTLNGLLSASRIREEVPSLVSLSGSAKGAEEDTYCRANENCSFEALLLRQKNSQCWNCARHIYVARKMSMYVFCEYDVIMTSALPFIAIFWQIRNKDVKVGRVVNFSY